MRTINDPINWELKGDWIHVETEEGEIIANGRKVNWIEVIEGDRNDTGQRNKERV